MPEPRIRTSDFLYHLDSFHFREGMLLLNGWLVHRREPLTHVTILINSKVVVERVELSPRPDVWEVIGGLAPHSVRSGLAVAAAIDGVHVHINGTRDCLEIIAIQDSVSLGVLTATIRDLDRERERLPVPPAMLAERVGGNNSFLETGLRVYSDIKLNVERYRRFSFFRSMLDWGCGCGRILRYMLEDFPASMLHGCDIDGEAIDWVTRSLPGPSFNRIAPFPPTSYADETFDFVYGISIFTHLTEDVQKRWLEELRRITKPKGIVAVSVLGELGAPAAIKPLLECNGFADVLSPQAAEFAPHSTNDYYRVAYHSEKYIFETWSKYMDILEYVEFGINSHQDLVIMEKAG